MAVSFDMAIFTWITKIYPELMKNIINYIFILLIFCNCTNERKKNIEVTKKSHNDTSVKIAVKFNQLNAYDVNVNYVDAFNDIQSFNINKNNTAMHDFEIKSENPIFLMDWTINQTYYVLYPGEKIIIEPFTEKKQALTVKSTADNQNRKNELLFFQALNLIEKTEASERMSQILGDQTRRTGKSGKDMSAFFLQIELAKNRKNRNTSQSYNFIRSKYEKRMSFLEKYKKEYPISSRFSQLISKFFQFEFEANAFEILKTAILNKSEITSELNDISAQSWKSDNGSWLFIPSYQNKLKNYLSYSCVKLNITTLKDKVNFINKEFVGANREFCNFLVFKDQVSVLDSLDKEQLAHTFTKSGQRYLNYINKNQEFYLNAGKDLGKKSTQLQSFNGKKISFEDLIESFQGKTVLLDFWASWCIPCKVDMPFSKRLHMELENEDVEFVYLSLDQNYNAWYRDAKLLGLEENSFLVNLNFKSELAKNLKINTIPRYILIDKKGKMVDLNAPRPSDRALKTKIEKLIQ